jgi:hypothetical protein
LLTHTTGVSELDDFNIRNDKKAAEAARSDARKDRMFRHRGSGRREMQRVGSGSSDDSSSSSSSSDGSGSRGGGGSGGRRHPRRQRRPMEEEDDEDEDEEGQQASLRDHGHIMLDMAMGTLVDSDEEDAVDPRSGQGRGHDEDDDDDGYGRRHQQRAQPQSSGRVDIASPIKSRVFSPGKGDWGQASSNAERYSAQKSTSTTTTIQVSEPARDEKRFLMFVFYCVCVCLRQQQAVGEGVTIDTSPMISPDSYTDMWDTMPTVANFDARLFAEEEVAEFKLVEMVEHLHNESFYVVAAGQVQDVATLYGFAAGTDTFGSPVYFLFELKILMNSEAAGQTGYWSFECVCKCTHQELASIFVKKMLLGDVLRLAG